MLARIRQLDLHLLDLAELGHLTRNLDPAVFLEAIGEVFRIDDAVSVEIICKARLFVNPHKVFQRASDTYCFADVLEAVQVQVLIFDCGDDVAAKPIDPRIKLLNRWLCLLESISGGLQVIDHRDNRILGLNEALRLSDVSDT